MPDRVPDPIPESQSAPARRGGPNQRQAAAKPRGGARPGAGAPRGNLNALKHGRRSRQFADLGALIVADPTARQAILALAHRHQVKKARAQEVAAAILVGIFNHARDIAVGIPSPGPFRYLAGLNAARKAMNDAQSSGNSQEIAAALEDVIREVKKLQTINQNPAFQSITTLPADTTPPGTPHD